MTKQTTRKPKPVKFKTEKIKKECQKRGRLIIRNLPFAVTEDALKNHFATYGQIKEVNILIRPDGKLVGCGFLQFVNKQSAAKAIHHTSGKPFMGRVIIVDWAIPKNKFVESRNPIKQSTKNEPLDEFNEISTKTEPHTAFNENSEEVTEKEITDETSIYESDSDTIKTENVNESTDDESEFPEMDDTKHSIAGNAEESSESVSTAEKPHPKPSHDIPEGKTVFLRNIPFNVSNDELKLHMETIGPVYYAVVCVDSLTEHSKGTGFVKFKNKIYADKCLEMGPELKLKGSVIEAMPAVEKKTLNKDREKHPDKKKDNRNLYLVKEGAVIAGTSAAIGVSMSDMKKRLELEVWKTNMLKNFNMFVSRTRLIVHNLPSSYDDKMLRSLFKKYGPPKSRITEAKVMKNLRLFDDAGKPVSKGYGFVSFEKHEDALAALRYVNNNPNIFNANKRPIVAFSIENRAVIKVKEKRMMKSRLNNPLYPESKKIAIEKANKREMDRRPKKRTRSENVPSFAGMESHPGQTKLPTKRKILSQEEIHFQNVKESKKESKRKQQILKIRKEKQKEPKVKAKKQKKKDMTEKQFIETVNKYKKQISVNFPLKKWYE